MPNEKANRPRVVFIMSTNYAGSTVLGLALGNHSRGLFIGEPARLVRKDKHGHWQHRRFCSTCRDEEGQTCPLWSKRFVDRTRRDPADLYQRILKAHAALGRESNVLIDASKSLLWLSSAVARRDLDIVCLHITKPVESFAASVMTRHARTAKLTFVARDWARRNAEIRNYCSRNSISYVHIRYPKFARDPATVLQRLSGLTGLEYEPAQEHYWSGTHHFVKGNPGATSHIDPTRIDQEPGINKKLYRSNHQRIFIDEKWRDLFSLRQIDKLYAIEDVELESQTLGYRHPLRSRGTPLFARLQARLAAPATRFVRRTSREIRAFHPALLKS